MIATAALTMMAIVMQDQVSLRASPRDSTAQQAVLWQGDSLEIRGEKGDYLHVYDHRRERSGYVRASQVRRQSISADDAPELLSIVRFLRDSPGSEALGISYVAAFLSAAPAKAIDAEIFDALGLFAERLARRASSRLNKTASETAIAHLDVAAVYGVKMNSIDREEHSQLCYDGEAYRRVMALPATPAQKANAALALTRHDCLAPTLTPSARLAIDIWRADVLSRVDATDLPPATKNRLHMRSAGLWASLAYQHARQLKPNAQAIQSAGQRALDELAAVNKTELMESDASTYDEAAIRVGASRWAAETQPAISGVTTSAPNTLASALALITAPGQPGQTCVYLVDAEHNEKNALQKRCTYGIVWNASISVSRDGQALALAVQPQDSWRELWVFQQKADGWHTEILPPGLDSPTLGYIEFSGWVPGNQEMLATREIKKDGRYQTRFETISLDTLETQKSAEKPSSLTPFYRWQDPAWKAKTVSLR